MRRGGGRGQRGGWSGLGERSRTGSDFSRVASPGSRPAVLEAGLFVPRCWLDRAMCRCLCDFRVTGWSQSEHDESLSNLPNTIRLFKAVADKRQLCQLRRFVLNVHIAGGSFFTDEERLTCRHRGLKRIERGECFSGTGRQTLNSQTRLARRRQMNGDSQRVAGLDAVFRIAVQALRSDFQSGRLAFIKVHGCFCHGSDPPDPTGLVEDLANGRRMSGPAAGVQPNWKDSFRFNSLRIRQRDVHDRCEESVFLTPLSRRRIPWSRCWFQVRPARERAGWEGDLYRRE